MVKHHVLLVVQMTSTWMLCMNVNRKKKKLIYDACEVKRTKDTIFADAQNYNAYRFDYLVKVNVKMSNWRYLCTWLNAQMIELLTA